jgi:hypothetical protein
MDLRILTIGELKTFVESAEFATLPNVPISPLRAISQQENPNAQLNDPALVIAFDETGEVLSYFGCLPDTLHEDETEKVCWSSCWWVSPQKGKIAVMPVFYKALQLWEGKMLFDALPDRSQAVLERMGYFSFRKMNGIHAFLHFKIHKIIPARFSFLAPMEKIFYGVDILLNLSVKIRLAFWKKGNKLPSNIRINQIHEIDEPTAQFIQGFSKNELIQREAATFNWIIQNPWLSKSKEYIRRYHFSSEAKQFQNILLQVFQNDVLIAFLWITNRDGTAKLPYCYLSPGNEKIVASVLNHQLIQLGVDTFICFQANVLEAFQKSHAPLLFRKQLTKVFGWSKKLDRYFERQPYIQDGDGDGVFT